jgi:hypothetical protein
MPATESQITYYYLCNYSYHYIMNGAGIAQSVQGLAMSWTTEGSEFESRWGQEFSLLHVVQTGSGVHPLLSNGYCGLFPRG